MRVSTRPDGFTLIELSIVLVIIGLIVGGILAGRDLIENAQILKIGTDIQKYDTAVNTFRTKYFGLPGDLPNATSFFPAASSCPASFSYGGTLSFTATCDGNGDGMIGATGAVQAYPPVALPETEYYQVFNQLYMAGLTSGPFAAINKTNLPTFRGGQICLFYDGGISVHQFEGTSATVGHHVFMVSTNQCMESGATEPQALFAPAEAQMIDLKFDDGEPFSGRVTGPAAMPGCTTGSAYNTSTQYEAGATKWNSEPGCYLYFTATF